jgi:hypothetical protein
MYDRIKDLLIGEAEESKKRPEPEPKPKPAREPMPQKATDLRKMIRTRLQGRG